MTTKKTFTLVFLLMLSSSIFAQGYNCSWVTPLLQGNILNSTYFFNANSGIAVGEFGTILRTSNAGASWVKVKSKTTESLKKNVFINDVNELINGQKGALLMTYNGGISWTKITVKERKLSNFEFVNGSIGYIGSKSGVIYKTINGGATWDAIQTGYNTT